MSYFIAQPVRGLLTFLVYISLQILVLFSQWIDS
jgi:hypothetical protein